MHGTGYCAALLQHAERNASLGGESWACCLSRQRQAEKTLLLGSSMKRSLWAQAVSTALPPGSMMVTPCVGGKDNVQSDAGYSNSTRQTAGRTMRPAVNVICRTSLLHLSAVHLMQYANNARKEKKRLRLSASIQ